MSPAPRVIFQRYTSESVGEILGSVVAPLYVATHESVSGKAFYGADRFISRLQSHAEAPNFELVLAVIDDRAVGQAYGYTLPQEARWWRFLTTPLSKDTIQEDGRRTFALCELMVSPEVQGRGIAHKLHDAILAPRREPRATLLVREENTAAQEAYAKWGWQKIGKLQPSPDSPNFDVLILNLAQLRSDNPRIDSGTGGTPAR